MPFILAVILGCMVEGFQSAPKTCSPLASKICPVNILISCSDEHVMVEISIGLLYIA